MGWADAKQYFANPNRRNRIRAPEKPNKTGERAILIPAFINDSHWTGIVCREIKDRVMFLYADDMNNKNDEINMQQLLQNTDNEFYPADAIWINCSNNLYLPHSNECGPRTLLALTIMGAHPAPFREMLLPSMHSSNCPNMGSNIPPQRGDKYASIGVLPPNGRIQRHQEVLNSDQQSIRSF
jgi:hypothetical protein